MAEEKNNQRVIDIMKAFVAGPRTYEQTNAMIGRELLETAAKFGLVAGIALSVVGDLSASSAPAETTSSSDGSNTAPKANSIKPPAQGSIPVAFLVSEGAVIIDFCGPWEVFQDVNIPGRQDPPFRLYTVAESTAPIHASGGMQIVPDYTLANAPAPNVIVIPAQSEPSEAMLEWIRKSTTNTDVTMSCRIGRSYFGRTPRNVRKPHQVRAELRLDIIDGVVDGRVQNRKIAS